MRRASSSSSAWLSAGLLGVSLALAVLVPGGLAKLGYPALGLFSVWAFWRGWPAKTALLGWLGLASALGSSAPPVPARILLPAFGFGLLAWLSLRDRRALSFALFGPRLVRGPALGVAALIKPTLGLALAFGWLSRERRSFWLGLGVVAGFSLLAFPLAGFQGHLNWWETFTALSSFQFTLENFHLGSPLHRWLGLPAGVALTLQEGFGFVVLALALWKAWRFKNWPVSVSLGIVAGYYVSTFLWDHHLLYGVPAFLSLAQVHPWFSVGLAAAWPITAPLGLPWLACASLLLLPFGLYFLNEREGDHSHRGRARQDP